MQRFLNAMKAQAGALDQAQGQLRFGTVSSVDPQSAAVRVLMQPEGVLSGWLPVASAWTGNGWGLVALPSPGDQVAVLPQEGDAEHGVVIGGAYSTARPPPQAPCGEFWLVHQSGSFLKLTNDGAVHVQGDLHVAGDVYDRHGALSQLRADYNGHRHANATSVPDKQD
jgi:phage baseplate assembly protein gpV